MENIKRIKHIQNIDWFEQVHDEDFISDFRTRYLKVFREWLNR